MLLKGRCLGTGRDIIGIMRLWCALLSTLTVVTAADLGRFESARTITLEFGGDIPDHGIFSEDVREPRTGGVYQVEHIAEFLSRDTKGTHGLSISCKVKNKRQNTIKFVIRCSVSLLQLSANIHLHKNLHEWIW